MWAAQGLSIQMVEGDFGLELPIVIGGVTLAANDQIKIKIAKGDNVLIEKVFDDISDNTVKLVLTEAESALLPVGTYCYSLDWYQDGAFMCNVIQRRGLKVVDKL